MLPGNHIPSTALLCWPCLQAMVRCCAVVAICLLVGSNARGDQWEGFESAETAWKIAEADCAVRTIVSERTWKEAHAGETSEHWHLSIGTGSKAYLAYDIAPARVIAELAPSVWLKSDRVGPQMFVRVVLPRALEPRTGQPITALVPGEVYMKAGVWQRLAIADLPLQVERQVRVLRHQFGSEIDAREAFIDKIVLNVYTKPGPTQLWIDDLEVSGSVDTGARPVRRDVAVRPAAFEGTSPTPPQESTVELDGSILLAGGRPIAIRMIEHNGESLEWLQAAGFNAVWMREPPTLGQLEDSKRLGLWLVAPPSQAGDGRLTVDAQQQSCVLAWSLGNKLGPSELEATRQLARELRVADNVLARPLIAGAIAPLAAYSRTASILLLEPPTLGGSFEMADYTPWLSERPRLARAGTPCWTLLASEPPSTLAAQVAVLGQRQPILIELDYQQLRLAAFAAVAAGSRGLVFQSRERLDAQNRAAQQRIDALRLINAELRLVEPWMAAGTYQGEVTIDDKDVQVSVLQTERARLLVIRRHASGQQFVVGPAEKDRVSLVIPGTPSSSHAYRLSTLGMEPVPHKRVTGGMHVGLESAGLAALVVITQDPLVLGRVAKDLAKLETEHARLHYDIVSRKLESTGQAARGLPLNAHANTSRSLDMASASLQQGLRLLSANDRRGAEKAIAQSEQHLADVQRGQFLAAVKAFPSPVASPLLTEFSTLPAHYQLAEQLRTISFGGNVLPAGEMEDLQAIIQSGWRHQRDPNVPVETAVELAPAPHGGQSSLHLRVFPVKPEEKPGLIETPPVWVNTPGVSVSAGKLVRIRGYVKTSPAIEGSREGVLVFDSLGGQALAQRIIPSRAVVAPGAAPANPLAKSDPLAPAEQAWQPFMLFRAVPEDTTLSVTFALTGLGDAWIDDIEISVLDLPQPEPPAISPGPEEIPSPGNKLEELPAPPNSARGWWPRLR